MCVFRQKLGIQRTFTLGDFESLLLSEDPSDLMEEALVRLLKSVYHGELTANRVSSGKPDNACAERKN